MLFQSISIFAMLASALAAPSSPPTYSNQPTNVAPTYPPNSNAYTTIQTFHTEVYHWTAELSQYPATTSPPPSNVLPDATRDAYISCTTDEERIIYKTQLQSQFTSLQECVQSTQKYISAQNLKHGDNDEESEKYVRDVRDCVQEIKYTGQGLIPVLGHGE